MSTPGWRSHLNRALPAAIGVILAGLITGHWLATILFASLLYLAWNLVNIRRLIRWLKNGPAELPHSYGVWSEIFDRISKLQKRNRDQLAHNMSVIHAFQSMSDAFPDATLVLDEHECIAWVNGAARGLLALKVPDDLGQPVTNLLRDPDFANWIAVADQVSGSFEMVSPRNSNVRLSCKIVPYREDQRLLILRDISDVYNLERVRRDFVANVSHELRTPLTVLIGYLECMAEECPEDLQNVVEKLRGQAHQMQALLTDLLELSRLQSDQPAEEEWDVDVPAMLLQLREQAEELSRGRHDIAFDVDGGLHLLGTPADLESAFRNLINNAVNYTPAGGSIAVAWRREPEAVVMSVRDTGIGIPERDVPRLTERFYRVGSDRSRHSGGTGLGLSIVKHVLNAHQATLEIESELGEGSAFHCRFPLTRQLRTGERPSAQSAD